MNAAQKFGTYLGPRFRGNERVTNIRSFPPKRESSWCVSAPVERHA